MQQNPASLQVIARALGDWWSDWVNQFVVNLAWALSWLTIVLGPPATLGLYYMANRLAHGESLGLSGLTEGGRRYFWVSYVWLLVNLVAVVIVGINYFFYTSFTSYWADVLKAFFLLVGLFWLVVQFYALPFLMEQEKMHLGLALRNGLFTALAAPGYTLVITGVAMILSIISVVTVAPLFLGAPCLIAVLGNHAAIERLEAFQVRR